MKELKKRIPLKYSIILNTKKINKCNKLTNISTF